MASRYLNNIRINDAYTFPSADGTDGQVITTDGAGVLSFADAAASDAIVLTVKNVSGGSLSVGTVVNPSPTASPPSGNVVEVIAADNSAASTMPAIGVLKTTLADGAEGDAIAFGRVSGLDTSSFSAGDSLYVNTSGGFTTTKPTGTAFIQKIGIVVRSHASSGTIEVFGANRTNDVPTPLYIDHSNQRLGIGTTSPASTLEIAKNDQTNGAVLSITNSFHGSDWNAGDIVGSVDFRIDDTSTTEPIRAQIKVIDALSTSNTYPYANDMVFSTARFNVLSEAMRIDSSGNVGIGTDAPLSKLQIGDGTGDDAARVYHSDNSYTEIRGYGVQFGRDAAYLRPTTDGDKSLNIGHDSRTWEEIRVNSNTFTIEKDASTFVKVDSSGNVGIGTTSPAVSLDIDATDAVALPSGTTAQRPSSPAAGMIRYNSTDGSFEGYTTEWGAIGGGGLVNIERNSYTGDGSDLTFDTTSTIDNDVNVQVYIDGVYQSKANYSTSGNTVTFGAGNAPANGAAVELIHHKGDTGAVIAAGAIDTDQIVDDAVTFDKIEDRYTAVGTITNTSGATTVDWSSAAVYKMNAALTAAIEFDFTNYKAGQVLTIYNLSGSYAVTLDSDAATSESFLKLAEQDYDGSATSMLQIECLADGDDAVFVYSVAQYASDTTI